MIRTGGNQGITAGYGQLFNLSGLGAGGQDMTNDLTYAFLEVIDEMSPILEPKPNVRLHRGSPPQLLDKVAEMIASSQGAPFLINFDERSMAGMMREARQEGAAEHIRRDNVLSMPRWAAWKTRWPAMTAPARWITTSTWSRRSNWP